MRKNKFFMLGIITVFVAILSLTFVSSTFARYTSQVSGTDSARVAKWSFTYDGQTSDADVIGNGQADDEYIVKFDLFHTVKEYDGTSTEEDLAKTDGSIIAPGTAGSFEFILTNNSEVSAVYYISFEAVNANNIPLQFKLDNGTWVNDISLLNLSENNKDTDTDTKLKYANTTDDEDTTSHTIYWRWAIGDSNLNNHDTELGIGGTATCQVTATITFYQVD